MKNKIKKFVQILLFLLISFNGLNSFAKDLLGFDKSKEETIPSEYINTNVVNSPKDKQENKEEIKDKALEKKFNSAFEKDLYDRQMRQIKYNQPNPSAALVFGESLFLGNFAEQKFTASNPEYRISIGDKLQVKIWGAYEYEETLKVDPMGNIFVPRIGPIKVLGIKNSELQSIVASRASEIFESNVGVYAALLTTQPVKVFVTGFVQKPGLYEGYSSDSILSYLDKAGGVDINRGSFIEIEVSRSNKLYKQINLYDFLLYGKLDVVQFYDGDTILVKARKNHISVKGDVRNSYEFEFAGNEIQGSKVIEYAKPNTKSNFAKITRQTGENINSFYMNLQDFNKSTFYPDDLIEIVFDKLKETISVSVEGEHNGKKKYILPYTATLDDLLKLVPLNERSNIKAIQIFREETAIRQKELFDTSLYNLERKLLDTSSIVSESQASLHLKEVGSIREFIQNAREQVKPKGQIILSNVKDYKNVLLQDNDTIFIPPMSSVISINGEVLFPNSIAYNRSSIKYYVAKAGGFTDNADKKKAAVIHSDGSSERVSMNYAPKTGDEVLIMPKIKFKWFPLMKEVSDIVFNAAVTARVLLFLK